MYSNLVEKSFWDEENRKNYVQNRLDNSSGNSRRGFYRMSVSVGKRGSSKSSQGRASAKFDYLMREGDYSFKGGKGTAHFEYLTRELNLDRPDDFVTGWAGNMPNWVSDPKDFWIAADEFERVNGTLYREIQINFDNAFTVDENITMAKEFVNSLLGNKHAYVVAYHAPKTLDKESINPHAHIIFSERSLDGIERSRDRFFKRYNSSYPERGGCKKETIFSHPKTNREWLLGARKEWANILNEHALNKGLNKVFTEKSLLDQGLTHEPETRLPLSEVNRFKHGLTSNSVKQLLSKRKERVLHYQSLDSNNSTNYKEKLNDSYRESYVYYQKEYQPLSAFKTFVSEFNSVSENPDIEKISLINSFMKGRANKVKLLENYALKNTFVKYEDVLKSDETYLALKAKYDEKIKNYNSLGEQEKLSLYKEKRQIKSILNISRKATFEKTKELNEQAVFSRSLFEHAQKDMRNLNKVLTNLKHKIRKGDAAYLSHDDFVSVPDIPKVTEKTSNDFDYYIDHKDVFLERMTAYEEKFSEVKLDKEIAKISPNKESQILFKRELLKSDLLVNDGEVYVDYWDFKRSNNLGQFYTTKPYLSEKNLLIHRVKDLFDNGKIDKFIQVNSDAPYPKMLNDMLNNKGHIFAINGVAGSGKSYAMKHYISSAKNNQKFDKVIGTSLTGKAALSISKSIDADEGMTLHKLETRLNNGSLWLDEKSVIIMDEAGMTGTKQMNRILAHVNQLGANIVLLGDTKQLSSVEAGTAFKDVLKALPDEMKADTLNVKRQRLEHHRDATALFFEDRTLDALDIYSNEGSIHVIEKGESASKGLNLSVDLYMNNLKSSNGNFEENILLAHKNTDVQKLNSLIREKVVNDNSLKLNLENSTGQIIEVVPGEFVSFTKNHRLNDGTEIMNGQQGTIKSIQKGKLLIERGKDVFYINPKEYNHIVYGYAMTIHKSQGITVDNAVLYAGSSTGNDAGYVAFTRHRNNFDGVFSEEVFERPDISLSSDYFKRVSTLNTKEDKQLNLLKNTLNQKLTQKEFREIEKNSLLEAKIIFEDKYKITESTRDIKAQIIREYSLDTVSATDKMNTYVSNVYSLAKKLSNETKNIKFITYKDALHQQKPIVNQMAKINQLKEVMYNIPSSKNNEKLVFAKNQLKFLYKNDEIRLSAKNLMVSHNQSTKEQFNVRDLLWQSAKDLQSEFKTFRKDLENQRLTQWQINKKSQSQRVDILWRKDLVERYKKGELHTRETLSTELVEKALNAGYNKLLQIQQKENPYDKPKLWRKDLINFEKSVLNSAKEKSFNTKEITALEQRTRELLLIKQSRNFSLKEKTKVTAKVNDKER